MLNHPTYERLTQRRLTGMARALAEQAQTPDIQALTFEERLGLLVEREADERHHRQTRTRLRRARLKQTAVAEDIYYLHPPACTDSRSPSARWRRAVRLPVQPT